MVPDRSKPPSPPPRRRPLSRWSWLWSLPVAFFLALKLFEGDRLPTLLFCAGVPLVVLFVQEFQRYRKRRFAARHPDEPWLWEKRWSTTVLDSNWHKALVALPLILLGLTILGALNVLCVHLIGFYFSDSAGGEYVGIAGIAFAVALIPTDFVVGRAIYRAFMERVMPLIRFGRVGVRLPQLPLALGTNAQVRLVSDRDLSRLSRVKVTLQRVREWNDADTGALVGPLIQRIEHEHEQWLDLSGHERGSLLFELEFPCSDPFQDSTVLSGGPFGASPRCLWKLHLVRDDPDNALHVTLVLPVYVTEVALRRVTPGLEASRALEKT